MKGTFFQKPLELKLEVEGESWKQGDPVSGTLSFRNHGSAPVPVAGARVHLARGELRKVRAKAAGAFSILASSAAFEGEAAAGGSASLPWRFELDANAAITDNLSSLFLVYGIGDAHETLGQLQLQIEPFQLIQDFLATFQTAFRFVIKSRRAAKGWVDVKLAPPSAKSFAMLEYVVAGFRMEGETLRVRYDFHVKKVDGAAAGLDVKKSGLATEQSLAPVNYRMASGRLNYEGIEAAIREALAEVESKVVF